MRALQNQPPAGISGTVTADAQPSPAIACARPALDDRATGYAVEQADRSIRCVTTTDGTYALADLAPGRWVVWASAPGKRGVRDNVKLAPAERQTVDIALGPLGKRVSGHVRDVRGNSIVNALVHLQQDREPPSFTTRSTSDGSFTAWTVVDEVRVVASADGFVDASVNSNAPTSEVVFALLPEAVLAGIVVDADTRAPVPNATVNAEGTRVETDDSGRFRVTKLTPGRYKPSATAIGKYGEANESVLLGLGRTVEGVVIEVHPVAVVAARIVTPDGGCPAESGRAFISRRGGGGGSWGVTTGDGDVLLEGVVPGAYEVLVYCERWLSLVPYPDLVVASSDVEDVTWNVIAGARISGRVTSSDGTPINDAIVNYHAGDGLRVGSTSTGPDGRFIAEGIVPGKLEAEARATDYLPARKNVVASITAPGTIDFVLDRGAAFSGIVTDDAGKPVRGIKVVASGADDGTAYSDAVGAFTMSGLIPGAYTLTTETGWERSRAEDPPDPARIVRASVARGETTRVKLVAESPRGAISGIVVDDTNAPVTDAYVDIARDDGDRRFYWKGRSTLAGLDGSFRITGLPTNSKFAVRAYRTGGAEAVATGVTVGERTRITLRPTGVLSGVVVDSTGAPVEDVRIEATDRARDQYRSERLFRTRGRFTLRDMAAGTYKVQADDDPRSAITVTLAESQVRTDLRVVVAQRYTLRGRLVGTDKKPLAGWKIEVPHLVATITSGERVVTTWTNEVAITATDGSFLVQNLAGETATVSAGDPRTDGTMIELVTVPLRGPPTIDVGELVVGSK